MALGGLDWAETLGMQDLKRKARQLALSRSTPVLSDPLFYCFPDFSARLAATTQLPPFMNMASRQLLLRGTLAAYRRIVCLFYPSCSFRIVLQ